MFPAVDRHVVILGCPAHYVETVSSSNRVFDELTPEMLMDLVKEDCILTNIYRRIAANRRPERLRVCGSTMIDPSCNRLIDV